jgi:hypothetical protein
VNKQVNNMVKLRFIQTWGPYKPGDIKDNPSPATVHWLVDVYKFAVIEPDNPVATAEPIETITDATAPKPVERDIYKYIRKPQRDKMTRGPIGAK